MKKLLFAALSLFGASLLPAQVVIISGSVGMGTSFPSTCYTGQLFVRQDQTSGSNVYVCDSANTFHALAGTGGGGSGSVTSFSVASTPSWLASSVANATSTPALTLSAATGQTAHQVIGTGSGSSFGPMTLTSADLPTSVGYSPTITSLYTETSTKSVSEVHKQYTIPYTAINAAATSQDIALATIPAGAVVDKLVIVEGTPFAGPSGLTSMSVSLGRGAASPSDFMLPRVLMQAAGNTNTSGGALVPNGQFTNSYTFYAEFVNTTSTTPINLGNGTSSNLTAGSLTVDVWFTN